MDLEPIIDIHGNERRNGSLLPPAGFVSAFNTFESEHPVWDDSDIRRVMMDSDRTPGRVLFDKSWILNQGSHGSCNGHGGASGLAKARVKRGLPKVLLSGPFLYSLINGGRDQGSNLEDGMHAIEEHGVCPASLVTTDMIYPRLQPVSAKTEALKHRGLQCFAVQTKQGFRTALAAGFPVIVAVQAGSNFQRLNSQGIGGVDRGSGNHATHCDDIVMVNGQECYDMSNSWGLQYGTEGRVYLTWDSFAEPFGNHVFFAIASTDESGE